MKKTEFLTELEEHLVGITKEDKIEIMQDYEEHFKIGKKKKRTEEEISKSLGNPKQIAREIRKELSKETSKEELKSEAIETWVAIKKFTKHIFNESKNKIEIMIKDEKERNRRGEFSKEPWIILVLILMGFILGNGFFIFLGLIVIGYSVFKYFKKNKKKFKISVSKQKQKKKKNSKKSSLKIVLSLMFNLLIFIWIWIAILISLVTFFMMSIIVIISGAVTIAFSIFALISYNTYLTKDIILSILFAGIGTILLGGLLTNLFEKLTKLYFILTKRYIELNLRFIKK